MQKCAKFAGADILKVCFTSSAGVAGSSSHQGWVSITSLLNETLYYYYCKWRFDIKVKILLGSTFKYNYAILV